MHIFALTGGIASGKTTVSNYMKGLGCPVIDADLIARQGERMKDGSQPLTLASHAPLAQSRSCRALQTGLEGNCRAFWSGSTP